ncbi:type II toxin-antitoxin system RelE/ParE family toxin [Pseudomonas sp. MWU13-2105]|uniref:type II toxin-antitoxin system RelE/ParE family toxin n=1 Tax=Pseudomonas sp. MWU13-2105 TaxID=2935074 RepID=UPI002010113F|nr:type II toxin-antitoxin system RelE/ParE family toxin [Pseudomonas sp. MWU13-2105]
MIIRWLPSAIHDRDVQLDYIGERNPGAAIDQGDRIEHQVGQLLDHPEMGRFGRIEGTRELVISGTPFVVVYRLRPRLKLIEIIRLLHGAQQWPKTD